MADHSYHAIDRQAFIKLDNLESNLAMLRERINPCKIMAVVKADAYGHGVIQVTRRLVEKGVEFFAVARMAEAMELIDNGIKDNIIIFGRLFPREWDKAISNEIIITLTCEKDLEIIAEHARKLNKKARIHINVDTGMGRTGILYENAIDAVSRAIETNNIKVEGIYSHFATADLKGKDYAMIQLDRFNKLLDELDEDNINIPYVHMANGGAILDIPESYQGKFNMVRTGIILYGDYPSIETSESLPLKPVMTLKTRVSEVRELPSDFPISYGCLYKTQETMRIAVLPIGYADGIHRSFTNNGDVVIRGKFYPIVGAVTMDQIMVAVDDQVQEGDEVVFWGESEKGIIRASRVAHRIGTVPYELTCSLSTRVPKVYENHSG